jgi:hypothetical protein
MEELGYRLSNRVSADFTLPEDTSLVLVLEPRIGITGDEWEHIDLWVEEGGTLVLAGRRWVAAHAVRHYDFELVYLDENEEVEALVPQNPLWVAPPVSGMVEARVKAFFETDRHDFVPHLAVEDKPVLVSFEQGAGQVFLSAVPFPFTNAGLKEKVNPELVLNLMTAGRSDGVIWFDDWHHGIRAFRQDVVGPEDWLRYTPSGRAALYAAVAVILALILQGRRFGRPVPLPKRALRRAPLEYVTAIANLSRRAGHRLATLQQYHHVLKRDLGRRYRLNPTLPDDEYVAQLSRCNPAIDETALQGLLLRLRKRDVSEAELVQLASEVATWLEEA